MRILRFKSFVSSEKLPLAYVLGFTLYCNIMTSIFELLILVFTNEHLKESKLHNKSIHHSLGQRCAVVFLVIMTLSQFLNA